MPRTPSKPIVRELPAPPDPRSDDAAPPSRTATPPAVLPRGTRKDLAPQAAGLLDPQEPISLIAHDIKTPLAIILLEAEIARARISPAEQPALASSLARIAENAAYIDRLIGDLLDAGAVHAGELELRRQRVDLARLIGEIVERAVSSVDRGRIVVRAAGPVMVDGDPTRLERVIANLLSNAFKYSPQTGRVTIQLEVDRHRAKVSVIDTGLGMTPEQTRNVFARYQRTESARDRDGYGLGLYISREIIVAHGGRIGVASAPGKGSRFFFELPAVP
ncbi:MAG: HAMP domain-containing histidine kinase [Myxococcota bacterium]|nr:HAMP domain-containing histidine kinase [Myxococcota bacterium]